MALPGIGADAAKWSMPGWKVERKFSDRVLIHNWYEESCKKERAPAAAPASEPRGLGSHDAAPTLFGADTILRRRRQPVVPNPGLSRSVLFGHGGGDPATDLVTWYDGDYSRRGERPEQQRLPELRSWDSKTLAWQPEKSDHPVQAAPTNWGLAAGRSERWQQHRRDGLDLGLGARKPASTYSTQFWPKQPDEAAVRYGVPRDLVTVLREYGRTIQRDGALRNVPIACASSSPAAGRPHGGGL